MRVYTFTVYTITHCLTGETQRYSSPASLGGCSSINGILRLLAFLQVSALTKQDHTIILWIWPKSHAHSGMSLITHLAPIHSYFGSLSSPQNLHPSHTYVMWYADFHLHLVLVEVRQIALPIWSNNCLVLIIALYSQHSVALLIANSTHQPLTRCWERFKL